MIKRLFIQVFQMLLLVATTMAGNGSRGSFSKEVNDAWLAGKKDAVYQIVKDRLNKNPNDLAGLLVEFEYAFEFSDMNQMRKLIPQMRAVAKTITAPDFGDKRELFEDGINHVKEVLTIYTREMVREEYRKGFYRDKRMSGIALLEALEADGLVAPLTLEERQKIDRAVVEKVDRNSPARSFSEKINDAWMAGKKASIYKIAENRLNRNPNDLAALLIELDYALEFADLDKMRDLIPKIRAAAETVKSPNISAKRENFEKTFYWLEKLLPTFNREDARRESYKGFYRNKRMSDLPFLDALDADGLIAPLTLQEREEIDREVASPEPTPPYPTSVVPPAYAESRGDATPASAMPSVTVEKISIRLPLIIVVLVGVLIAGLAAFFLRRR